MHAPDTECMQGRGMRNVLGLVVLELYVQAVLDSDLHLNRVVAVGRHTVRMYPEVFLLGQIRYSS